MESVHIQNIKVRLTIHDFEEVEIQPGYEHLDGRSVWLSEDSLLFIALEDPGVHPYLLQPGSNKAIQMDNTGSKAHMQLIGYWLEECRKHHSRCQAPDPTFLPTRLIEIETCKSTPRVRLYPTSSSDSGLSYTTLSHCWGGAAKDIPQLTLQTYAKYVDEIPFEDLPRNFQDAVQVTQALGLRHLWIDSLCIIQDSKDDWAAEAATMAPIYENSACTIAAAAAPNPFRGCFSTRDPLTVLPCKMTGEGATALYASRDCIVGYRPAPSLRINEAWPLNSRGWIVQELLLSRRILYFGDAGILWNCRTGQASESFDHGYGYRVGPWDPTSTSTSANTLASTQRHQPQPQPYNHVPVFGPDANAANLSHTINPDGYFDGQSTFDLLLEHQHQHQPARPAPDSDSDSDSDSNESCRAQARFHAAWFKLVATYTARHLSFPSDRLVALSAIAQRVQQATGFIYVAGLWDAPLALSLLWRTSVPAYTSSPSPAERPPYQAPTWSWASINTPVRGLTPMKRWKLVATVLEASVQTHAKDVRGTGQVDGGFVRVFGVVGTVGTVGTVGAVAQAEEGAEGVDKEGAAEGEEGPEDHTTIPASVFSLRDSDNLLGKAYLDIPVRAWPADARLLPIRIRSARSPASDDAVQGLVVVRREGGWYERLGCFFFGPGPGAGAGAGAGAVVDCVRGWERAVVEIR